MAEGSRSLVLAFMAAIALGGCALKGSTSRAEAEAADAQFVAIGEIHGIQDTTVYVLDLALEYTARGAAVLLLAEQPTEDFPRLVNNSDQFAAFVRASQFWRRTPGDGRTGAYRACRIARALDSAAGLLHVGSFDPFFYGRPEDADIEAGMAARASQIIDQFRRLHPRGVIIFWAGNHHVYRLGPRSGVTAAQLIASRLGGSSRFVYLWPVSGSAHVCERRACFVRDISQGSVPESLARAHGVEILPQLNVSPDGASVDFARLDAAC